MAAIYTGVESELHALIDDERARTLPFAIEIQRYRDYTAGRQNYVFTDEQKIILSGVLGNRFCDNACRRVVSTVSGRVRYERAEVADKAVERFIQDVEVRNQIPQLSRQMHFSGVRDGDCYLVLGWDNLSKRVTLRRELAWNGHRGTFVAYNETGEPVYGVKEWNAWYKLPGDKVPVQYKRRVVWLRGKIGRFIFRKKGWEWFALPAQLDEEDVEVVAAEKEGWQEWKNAGAPIGIPCVKFSRMDAPRDSSEEELGASDNYGSPILDGGPLGAEDIINDGHYNLVAGARFAGLRQAWASGVALTDDKGNPVTLRLVPGSIIHVSDAGAKFGAIEAADLNQLISFIEAEHKTIARTTNTPTHIISGEWPSGEALIQADRPLVDQATSLVDGFGTSWATVFYKAILINNAFNPSAALDETQLIKTIFAPTELADILTRAAVAEKVQTMVSRREVLRILGYPPAKIEQIIKEMDEDAQRTTFLLSEANGPGANVANEAAGGGAEEDE